MQASVAYAWLAASLLALVVLQRLFHFRLQAVLLLLLRDANLAAYIYAVLFLPGTALHELSHWAAARLLGVRVHGLSLLPSRSEGGAIRFGYVETGAADPIRSALIGLAPLLTGSSLLAYVGLQRLGLAGLGATIVSWDGAGILVAGRRLLSTPDLAVWVYLALAVSNTMLPSASDRSAWAPALGLLFAVGAILAFSGLAPQLVVWVSGGAAATSQALASVFTLAGVFDLVFLPALWGLQRLLSLISGLEVGR